MLSDGNWYKLTLRQKGGLTTGGIDRCFEEEINCLKCNHALEIKFIFIIHIHLFISVCNPRSVIVGFKLMCQVGL